MTFQVQKLRHFYNFPSLIKSIMKQLFRSFWQAHIAVNSCFLKMKFKCALKTSVTLKYCFPSIWISLHDLPLPLAIIANCHLDTELSSLNFTGTSRMPKSSYLSCHPDNRPCCRAVCTQWLTEVKMSFETIENIYGYNFRWRWSHWGFKITTGMHGAELRHWFPFRLSSVCFKIPPFIVYKVLVSTLCTIQYMVFIRHTEVSQKT